PSSHGVQPYQTDVRSSSRSAGYTPGGLGAIVRAVCRNIRVLHNFEPPTSHDEIRAAALQYVRKVSGLNKPAHADQEAFDRAIDEVARATEALLTKLPARPPPRTREREREKARARWQQREARAARG